MYDLRRKNKEVEYLTDEEWELLNVLTEAGYTFDENHIDMQLFVPTAVLYQTYRRGLAAIPNRDACNGFLTIRQFGAALRRVWLLEETLDTYRVYRKWHGKRCWGIINVRGPEAIISRDAPGRPSNNAPSDSHTTE